MHVDTGWRSRGYLPHCDAAGAIQHVVFRLADALPARALAELDRAPNALRLEVAETSLDRGVGNCALRDPRLAACVQQAVRHFDGARYQLIAWCVMPSHVHALFEEVEGWPLSVVVHGWKSFTAHTANRSLGRQGRFWAREYFDRQMRDDDQVASALAYIENNPVVAGLCAAPGDWPWSSAPCRRDAGAPSELFTVNAL